MISEKNDVEFNVMAATPAVKLGERVKQHWDTGREAARGSSQAAELARDQRLAQNQGRFRPGAGMVHAGTTAVKGLTSTQSGGSGNPTIRPTNDET